MTIRDMIPWHRSTIHDNHLIQKCMFLPGPGSRDEACAASRDLCVPYGGARVCNPPPARVADQPTDVAMNGLLAALISAHREPIGKILSFLVY